VPAYVYTPSNGAADPAWAPAVNADALRRLHVAPGQTVTLTGTQFSGRTQGSNYGDDGDSATNFPLVRITNQQTGRVEYARTSGFTTRVASGSAPVTTQVTLPADLDRGNADLVVVANGIASKPVKILVSR